MSVSRSRITGSYAERRESLGPLPFLVEHIEPTRRRLNPFGFIMALTIGLAIAMIALAVEHM